MKKLLARAKTFVQGALPDTIDISGLLLLSVVDPRLSSSRRIKLVPAPLMPFSCPTDAATETGVEHTYFQGLLQQYYLPDHDEIVTRHTQGTREQYLHSFRDIHSL